MSSWKKNFFYPKGQYGLGSSYSTIQYDFETKDHIELKEKYLNMEKLREIINNAMEFFTCTEEDIKEWFDEEDEEDEDEEEVKEEEEDVDIAAVCAATMHSSAVATISHTARASFASSVNGIPSITAPKTRDAAKGDSTAVPSFVC